jgi:hypothetical protein
MYGTLQSTHDPSMMRTGCLSNYDEVPARVDQLVPHVGELLRTEERKRTRGVWVVSPVMRVVVEVKIGDGLVQLLFSGPGLGVHASKVAKQ